MCYFSAAEGRFTYYINSYSTGFKIEFPISHIESIKVEQIVRKKHEYGSNAPERDDHRAYVRIELVQPPSFYSDHRGEGWQECHDFTQELVASTTLMHILIGPYNTLKKQMNGLASMNPEISSRLFMEDLPHFLFDPALVAWEAYGLIEGD